jgi:protein SCO1
MTLVKTSTKPAPKKETKSAPDAATFSSSNIPDTPVYDQDGRQLNFYSDLVKNKTVAINFIFTTCTAICPPLTATFRRVQQDAAARGVEVQLVSVSVDPTVDTPERLQEFAAKFKAGPGWSFITGDKARIDSVLQALGAAVSNKNDHTPMILIGNDTNNNWTRVYGLTSPTKIVDLLANAAKRTSASLEYRCVQLPHESSDRVRLDAKIDLQSMTDAAHNRTLTRNLVRDGFDCGV